MTADARVDGSTLAYLALARKVMSPGPAASSVATRVISMLPSPSRRQSRRSASSLSLMNVLRTRDRHPVEERDQVLQAQALGDGVHFVLAFARLEGGYTPQDGELG